MGHSLLHISRFPRSYRGEEQMVAFEGKNWAWNVPGVQRLSVHHPVQAAWVLSLVGDL